MEVIKKKSSSYFFKVLKPFRWAGYTTEANQEIQMAPAEGLAAVQRGGVTPIDTPEIGEYICLVDITLPGDKEAFKAKRMEKVLLKKDQALDLMLKRLVIPVDASQWRPYGLRLRRTGEAEAERKKIEALDKARFEEQAAKIGILQKNKKG